MKLKGRNKVSPEFSMSSMTDIVFLLLVFFMLTSNSPNAIDFLLPKAQGKSTNRENISVSIDRRKVLKFQNKTTSFSKLERQILQAIKGVKDPVLNVKAEESVPYGEVIKIMDIANRHKIKVIAEMRPPK